MTYREIVENYGKWQIPRGEHTARLQLYETFSTQRINAYDLGLAVNIGNDKLEMFYSPDGKLSKFVSSWEMAKLRETLLIKHHETFWVKAVSKDINGQEHFRYDIVLHTKKPNASLLSPLLESGKITLDLAAHFKADGGWRDHGILFKMQPQDLSLLLGESVEYNLEKITI